MLREPFILLLVALEVLLGAPFHAAVDVLHISIITLVVAFQHKESLVVRDDLRIDGIVGTPAKREIVDGIEKVGLTHTIMADKTVDLGRKLQVGALDVFVINNGNIL